MLILMRFGVLFLVLFAACYAETPQESVQDLMARLSAEQKAVWDQASKAMSAQQFPAALAAYKQLLNQMPLDSLLSKFAAEAAVNADESAYAVTILKPLAVDPNDWQTTSLLARACAQTGDSACRDSNMTRLLDLHRRGIAPPNFRQFIVERVKAGDNTLTILSSLEPLGAYKIYDTCRVMDGTGKVFLRITIESGDTDQPFFAQAHPKEAAQGMRAFSLDGYQETGLNSNGQRTQTHFTYKTYVGEPSYEDVRQAFIAVTNGKIKPMSSRSGLIVQ